MKPRLGKSFGSYCRKVFESSLITSFPEIAASRSWAKRLVKVLVFFVCTVGFCYQTMEFLQIYLAYPTIVNVDITDPFMVQQPGITVCNINRRRRTVICTREANNCTFVDPPKAFCEKYPMQCPRMVNKPKKAFRWIPGSLDLTESDFSWERAKEEAHNESMFEMCVKHMDVNVSRNCNKPYLPVPVILETGEPNYCYSIESHFGKPNAQPDIYANFFSIFLNLKTQPDEYVVPSMPIRMRLALHDRRARINPFEPLKGDTLKAGIEYVTYVSMVSKERLPHPYDTNCTDYLKLWKENNGTGPLNEIMCVEQCKLNKLLERGLCIEKTVFYPHQEQLCSNIERIVPSSITESILKECYSECGYACREHSYEAIYQEVDRFDNMCWIKDIGCKNSYTGTTFNFKKYRHTKYVSQPKFESVELFSYLGGYMGMWLGVSFITLFDLIETLFQLVYYPIHRTLRKKRRVDFEREQGTYKDRIVVY